MSIAEFDVIQRYFSNLQTTALLTNPCEQAGAGALTLGVGDDGAVINLRRFTKQQLVVVADTMVEGTHFFPQAQAHSIGYKCLIVNLSDIAAMGAKPLAFTLCLTLPHIDHQWLAEFSRGLTYAAQEYEIALIGGDTTHGPRAISVQALGLCQQPLTRSGGQSGELIFVTGTLGDAAYGLELVNQQLNNNKSKQLAVELSHSEQYLIQRFEYPQPKFGLLAEDTANESQADFQITACIDVSDGLIQDLNHICNSSQLLAAIDIDALPVSEHLVDVLGDIKAQQSALVGGEDYELIFTVAAACAFDSPIDVHQLTVKLEQQLNTPVTLIGTLCSLEGSSTALFDQARPFSEAAYYHNLRIYGIEQLILNDLIATGFQHFQSE